MVAIRFCKLPLKELSLVLSNFNVNVKLNQVIMVIIVRQLAFFQMLSRRHNMQDILKKRLQQRHVDVGLKLKTFH